MRGHSDESPAKTAKWLLVGLVVFTLLGVIRVYPRFGPVKEAVTRAGQADAIAKRIQKLAEYHLDGPVMFGPDGPRVALHCEDRHYKFDQSQYETGRKIRGGWQGPSVTRVFDLNTGNALTFNPKHNESILGWRFSPDGKTLLTLPGHGDGQQTARLWDLGTGKQRLAMKPEPEEHPADGTFSSDGDKLLVATEGAATDHGRRMASYVWDASTGELIERVQFPEEITDVAFSPDGRFVLMTGRKAASVRDRDTGKFVTLVPAEGYSFSQTYMGKGQSFSHDGFHQHAITIERNDYGQHIVRVRNVHTGDAICAIKSDKQSDIMALALSPFEHHLAIATTGPGEIMLFDFENPKSPGWRRTTDAGVLSFVFSPDGERLAVVGCDHVEVLNTRDGKVVAGPLGFRHQWKPRESISEHWLSKAAFSPDGRRLVLVDRAGYAGIWDVRTGKEIRRVCVTLD